MICDNCGQEVDSIVFIKPPSIWEFWKKGLCLRCDYNQKHGTNLDAEQWTAKINSPPKTEFKKDVASYEDFLNEMRNEKWHVTPKTLTHLIHRGIEVEKYKVERGDTNRILGIECPYRHVITICGTIQSYVDPRDFAKAPHLYTIPHEFSILCYDEDNNELPPETIILPEKVETSVSIMPLEPVLYGDLSLKTGGRFKRKEERYCFPQGIILYGGEWLFLNVVKSGRAIDRVEFFIRCDFFSKEG